MTGDHDHDWENDKKLVERFENSLKSNLDLFFEEEELEDIVRFYFDQQKYLKALRAAEYCLEKFPFSVEIKLLKAQCLIFNDELEEGLGILENINKEAEKKGLCISVLLQFHIAQEESKQGFDPAQVANFSADYFASLKHVSVAGVMGMASLTADKAQVRHEFQTLKNTFDTLKQACFQNAPAFKHISMGMSQDYDIALAEGANILRIGSLFFT